MPKAANSYSVLIFEDDLDLARQWAQALRDRGVVVKHAMSLEAAESYCAQTKFDAIVCDLFIQDDRGEFVPRAGYMLLSYLRGTGLGKMPDWGTTVPILVVTGSPKVDGFDALKLAKAMGGTALMRKPFRPDDLVSNLFALLGEKSPASDETGTIP